MTQERVSWDQYFLNIASVVASRSTCTRASVGVVLTNGNRLVGVGYNGAPPGAPHCTDDGVGCLVVDGHCIRSVHAEVNALLYGNVGVHDHQLTLYCNIGLPCVPCTNMIIGRVSRVVVPTGVQYHDNRVGAFWPEYHSAVEMLQVNGIEVWTVGGTNNG